MTRTAATLAAARRYRAMIPTMITVVVLFGGALIGALRTSLLSNPFDPGDGLTLAWWREVLADPAFVSSLGFTAYLTVVTTVISAGLAIALAAALRHTPLARFLATLPVLMPHLLAAVVAALWLAPGGLVDRTLGDLPVQLVRDRAGLGILLVYVLKETPFLALLVLAAWGPEVHAREEAARVLGADRRRRLALVVWPAIRAPLAIGSLIVAAFVFGSFEVPLVVGPTAPTTVATYALDQTKTASLSGQALAAVALLITSGVSVGLALIAARFARSGDLDV